MILDGFLDTVRMLLADAETTERFIRAFQGSHVIFPKDRSSPSFARLVAAIGADAAERLRAHFAGEQFDVPRDRAAALAARDEEIMRRVKAGESIRDVARSVMQLVPITERQVRRIVREGERGGRRKSSSKQMMAEAA